MADRFLDYSTSPTSKPVVYSVGASQSGFIKHSGPQKSHHDRSSLLGIGWEATGAGLLHAIHFKPDVTGQVAELEIRVFCHWLIDQLPAPELPRVIEDITDTVSYYLARDEHAGSEYTPLSARAGGRRGREVFRPILARTSESE